MREKNIMMFYLVVAIAIVAYTIWRIVKANLKAGILREMAKNGAKISSGDLDDL
jgi:hypothetical protein